MKINVMCLNGHQNEVKITPPCNHPIRFCKKCHIKIVVPVNFGGNVKEDKESAGVAQR